MPRRFRQHKAARTIVSSSYPVNRERRGTGTTLAIPSRTAATCSSNSWSLKKQTNKTQIFLTLVPTFTGYLVLLVPSITHSTATTHAPGRRRGGLCDGLQTQHLRAHLDWCTGHTFMINYSHTHSGHCLTAVLGSDGATRHQSFNAEVQARLGWWRLLCAHTAPLCPCPRGADKERIEGHREA